MKTGFVTGWCSGPNHGHCHHVYAVRERTYTCECECHQARPVKRVARRADTNGQRPVRYVQRRAR